MGLSHRLYEFQRIGKYCDVNVRVQDTIFHCHRMVLASESGYFDEVFMGNNGNESLSKDIVLNIIDPVTFNIILKYVYFEDLPAIHSSNVEIFLKAGVFLEISGIVGRCENFLRSSTSSFSHSQLFQLLGLAHALSIPLKDYLSQHIAQNLMDVVRHSAFLEVPYETLKIVMKQYRSCIPYSRENFLLDGLIRWIFHSYRDRRKYFEELEDMIDFEKISTEYVDFLSKELKTVEKLEVSDEAPSRIKIESLVLKNGFAQDHRLLTVYEDSQSSGNSTIHIFWALEVQDESHYKVYSLDEKKIKPEWICSRKIVKKHGYHQYPIVEFTPFNGRIYCFGKLSDSYSGGRPSSFCTYLSLDFASESSQMLSPFPLADSGMHSFGNPCNALTGFGNDSIYLYSSNVYHFSRVRNALYLKNFNEEEYNRNFYVYNLTQDEWLPVNPMKRAVKNACLIADDELVYLIGGEDKFYYGGNESIVGYAQAYDPRLQTWLKLPRTNFSHTRSSGCNLNGKIYVWNGERIEVYDPRATRWQAIESNFIGEEENTYRKILLPFKNQLYLFDLYNSETCIYNPVSQERSSLVPLKILLNLGEYEYSFSSDVKNVFVF